MEQIILLWIEVINVAQQYTSYKYLTKIFTLSDIRSLSAFGDWPITQNALDSKTSNALLLVNTVRYGTDNFSFSDTVNV